MHTFAHVQSLQPPHAHKPITMITKIDRKQHCSSGDKTDPSNISFAEARRAAKLFVFLISSGTSDHMSSHSTFKGEFRKIDVGFLKQKNLLILGETPLNTLNISVARAWMFRSCIVTEPSLRSSLNIAFLALNAICSAL